MNLTNDAAKELLRISKENNVAPSMIAEIRRVILADIELQMLKHGDSVEQTLGKVLGYPYYCADQKNFPGSTEKNGVCVGEHVPESIADEAANTILRMSRAIKELLSSTYAQEPYTIQVLVKGLGSYHGPSVPPAPAGMFDQVRRGE